MVGWPQITEPLLRERQAMSNEKYAYAERRSALVHKYVYETDDRVPLLTHGANASPERLALKLGHLPDRDHEALILAGELEGFDVGAVAQPPVFSSMPATLITSPGSRVRVAVLFLTPAQFTALGWTELTYVVGALTGIALPEWL
jgi:hypothetical protein